MPTKTFETIGEFIYWSYANLAMAHAALKSNKTTYGKTEFMIRARLYKNLCNGTMHISTLYEDEKVKLNHASCSYCGCSNDLSLDHLIPRKLGGSDSADNLICACRFCNSSKNKTDLLVWYKQQDQFPPLLILRRYLKLAYKYYESADLLDKSFSSLSEHCSVFRIDMVPYSFPQPALLRL